MRTFEAMLITIISISVIGAYAHDTRSPIDLEPIEDWCNLSFDPITQLIEWSCHEIYEVPEELGLIEPKVPDLPEDEYTQGIVNDIKELLDPTPEMDSIEDIDRELPFPFIEIEEPVLTPEEQFKQDLIDRYEACLYAQGPFAAMQTPGTIEYFENKTRFEFAERDNLSNKIPVLRIIKAIEECDGMKEALKQGIIGPREAHLAEADKLGIDLFGRSEVRLGLNETSPYRELKTASAEDLAAEAKRTAGLPRTYIDPYQGCIPINDKDTRCENRGNPDIGKNIFSTESCSKWGDEFGYPLIKCKQDIYNDWLSERAASILNRADYERTITDAYDAICENYSDQYGHLPTEKQPEWFSAVCDTSDKVCYKGTATTVLKQVPCRELLQP